MTPSLATQRFGAASRDAHRFVVGRDRAGRWIVGDSEGLHAGVFADHQLALRFARAGCSDPDDEVLAVPDGTLSLEALFNRH